MAETIDFKKANNAKLEKRQEQKTASDKISEFVSARGKPLLAFVIVAVLAIVIFTVTTTVTAKTKEKNLAALDTITHELTDGTAYLSEDEIEVKRVAAMEQLSKYVSSGGITGVRANMLAAEIEFSRKKYSEALGYWNTAVSKGSTSYTAALAYFNMAVCNEELGDLDAAVKNYEKASTASEFPFSSHAKFSVGRIKETNGDFSGANDAYQSIVDASPDDTWANLARSRQIALRTEGKISK